MDLRTFVSTSLQDIMNGVADAQAELPVDTIIPTTNPTTENAKSGLTAYQAIEINVVVRIDETNEKNGKISVWSSGLGGSSEPHAGQETKLLFKVPVRFPEKGSAG